MKNPNFMDKDFPKALKETFLDIDKIMASEDGQEKLKEYTKAGNQDYTQNLMGTDQGLGYIVGCTANVVLIVGTTVFCANAGDSRAILCSGGKAKEMSKDHKPSNKKERSRIEKAGRFVEDDRVDGMLSLSRALGDH